MLKKVLAFTAFFALAACSEDVYQEIDQQNEEADMMAPPTFNEGSPGYYAGPGDFGDPDGYYSPWDIWERPNMNVPYSIFNNVSGLTMTARAYIGLAYFDGTDDGIFTDPNTPGFAINMGGMSYSNLYANSQEIGNLIPSVWITAEPELVFWGSGGAHCPVLDGNGGTNPNNQYFHLPTATGAERQLLARYGKVFFYEVEVRDAANNLLSSGFVQARCDVADPAFEWNSITSVSGFVPPNPPGIYTGNLFYYLNSTLPVIDYNNSTIPVGHRCDSREVVYDFQYQNSLLPFNFQSIDYYVNLEMTVGHPM